jgi:hypothetical protein
MAQEEIFGTRDRAYSAWHRRLSTRRFVGIERAQLLSMIDLDGALYVEFDGLNREPLALIETARDVGQANKCAAITTSLARRARLPAFCVLYRCAAVANPADRRFSDIAQFRVRRLWPRPERAWRVVTPPEWAWALLRIREWSARRLDAEAANDESWGPEQPSPDDLEDAAGNEAAQLAAANPG